MRIFLKGLKSIGEDWGAVFSSDSPLVHFNLLFHHSRTNSSLSKARLNQCCGSRMHFKRKFKHFALKQDFNMNKIDFRVKFSPSAEFQLFRQILFHFSKIISQEWAHICLTFRKPGVTFYYMVLAINVWFCGRKK